MAAVAALRRSLTGDWLALGFEQGLREFRLANDAAQGSAADRVVQGNGNGYRGCLETLLHDPVAALLADRGESMLFENPANFRARENSEPTQPAPQLE